jgi:type IV pilus assembly protein PilO
VAINVSLSKLPWYGQIGAFVVLSLAGAGAFWNFYARDAQASIDQRRAQLAKLRQEIDRGLSTAKRLPEFRAEVASLESQLERLRAVLPEEQDVADLLRRVQAMATQSNLAILGFTPKAVAKKQLHAEWPIGLKLEGNYHDLGSFLERVSKFPRIINVGDIKISSRTNQSDGSTITAECTATTFVLLDQKEVAAAAAAKSGAKPGAAPAAPRKTE